MRKILMLMVGLFMTLVVTLPTHAEEKDWKFEVTPYLWMAGIEGDVTVGSTTLEADVGFSDLFDATDAAFAFLSVTQYKQWVIWTQLDFMSLSTDELDDPPPLAEVNVDTIILTLAGGYQFPGPFGEGSTIDALVGVRYLGMETEVVVGPISVEKDTDITDVVLVLRPSAILFKETLKGRLRFNPTLSIGGGDSDLTYELQPQFQYQITDHIAGRLGYRRLYYDIDGDRVDFDGTFHGILIGIGGTF